MDMFLVPEFIYTLLFLNVTVLIILVLFLLTVRKALNRCTPENQDMKPGQVWLMLIPVFNIIWQYILVSRTASSLAKEFKRRDIPLNSMPGKSVGLAFCILFSCIIIPGLNILAVISGLICFIIYWVKISGYSSTLALPFKPRIISTEVEKSQDVPKKEEIGKPDNKTVTSEDLTRLVSDILGSPEKRKEIALKHAQILNSLLDLYEARNKPYIAAKEDVSLINRIVNSTGNLTKTLEVIDAGPDVYAIALSYIAHEYKSLGAAAGDVGFKKEINLLIRKIIGTGGRVLMNLVLVKIQNVDDDYYKIIQKYYSAF